GAMPEHVVRRLIDLLNGSGKSVRGSRILILGVAYKRDTSDVRESPALDVMRLLELRGARIQYHDPHVPAVKTSKVSYRRTPLTARTLSAADCVVVITDHEEYDYEWIVAHSRKLLDTRN